MIKRIGVAGMLFLFSALFFQCRQEMPITASIFIDVDAKAPRLERNLYGVSLDEINHAVEGGIYGELIQNRSFEDGILPLNCRFDAANKVMITPNGWTIPFCGEDSIVGWSKFSSGTQLALDRKELINGKNKRSLYVGVYETGAKGRGGVVAKGYNGIPIRKGDKYELSLFLKSAYTSQGTINIALESSDTKQPLSDMYRITPITEWQRLTHTFTATSDADNAVLSITTDTTAMFWLDVVSLFPKKTWKGRKNGFRVELMDAIAALNPRFVRFPGSDFAEGYTAGTYPEWKETIGDIAERAHFWSVAGYGTSNGAGFHEYLQLCEDLNAEPIYVINSGITSQSRRPRYEELKTMDIQVQHALDAIEYANAPTDSVWGAVRARNGHPTPFNLKYIQIGSKNQGIEYAKRYALFRQAIKERYPDIQIIASDYQPRTESWTNCQFYANETFLIAQYNQFETQEHSRKHAPICIDAFSVVDNPARATLRQAVAEACFLIGVERNPDVIKQVAYGPLLNNMDYMKGQPAAINFTNTVWLKTPSYYVMQLFAANRGEALLKTDVTSYQKPQVTFGAASISLFDNAYEIKQVAINSDTVYPTSVLEGAWTVSEGTMISAPNKWNYILFGDSAEHDYVLTAHIRRTKGSGPIQFNVRDNGLTNSKRNRFSFTVGLEASTLNYQVGETTKLLSTKKVTPFTNNEFYNIKVICKDELIQCYVNDSLIHDVQMPSIPSLVAVATLDKTNKTIILKVVNTTFREEKTQIECKGIPVKSEVQLIELTGDPSIYNTLQHPEAVMPRSKTVTFFGTPLVYTFPPNSVTLMLLNTN